MKSCDLNETVVYKCPFVLYVVVVVVFVFVLFFLRKKNTFVSFYFKDYDFKALYFSSNFIFLYVLFYFFFEDLFNLIYLFI